VIKHVRHSAYDAETSKNDLLILKLATPVPDDIATPIALAHRFDADPLPGATATLLHRRLRGRKVARVAVRITSKQKCMKVLKKYSNMVTVDNSMLCAGGKILDLGFPLIVGKDRGDVLVGGGKRFTCI
jgi:hypothetical protein